MTKMIYCVSMVVLYRVKTSVAAVILTGNIKSRIVILGGKNEKVFSNRTYCFDFGNAP